MPDINGYPTEEELQRIKDWDFIKRHKEIKDFLEFLESIWWAANWGFKLKGKKVLQLELHTAGWSGNEDIISVLASTFFWHLYWKKAIRGGHYYFKIKPMKENK